MISLKDGHFFVGAKRSRKKGIVMACVFVLAGLNEVLSANFDIGLFMLSWKQLLVILLSHRHCHTTPAWFFICIFKQKSAAHLDGEKQARR